MIKIKTAAQIEEMKKAGALSKMALRHVGAMVRPGVSTFELDQLAEQIIRMHGGKPAFKGYGGFPGVPIPMSSCAMATFCRLTLVLSSTAG